MTSPNVSRSVYLTNFLQGTPNWYKAAIIAFLIINPILFHTVGPFVTGWVLILEFIFTLAMALKAYPLAPGGLLAIEAAPLVAPPFLALRPPSATSPYHASFSFSG